MLQTDNNPVSKHGLDVSGCGIGRINRPMPSACTTEAYLQAAESTTDITLYGRISQRPRVL